MNPLLETFQTPFETIPFDKIENHHFLPALQAAIQEAKQEIKAIYESGDEPDFVNTIEALETSGDRVGIVANTFFNLNSAETNDEIQKLAREMSPLLTEYRNDILLDEQLFARIKTVYEQREQLNLSQEARMLLENTYKSFVRNGANLQDADKQKLREIDKELAQLSLAFGENVLAETNVFELVIENEEDLAGIPEDICKAAAAKAKEKDKPGKWVFTLEYPSYIPFMKYAQKRELRKQMYQAFMSKGFKGDERDNQEIVKQIVKLRHQRAQLLGYKTHADFVLEERMAESPQKVQAFLENILQYALPAANIELEELTEYANRLDQLQSIERWDFAYYGEKLKKEKFAYDDEILKPYFQLEKVIQGVFQVAEKLYGLRFVENPDIPVYHPEVTAYEVKDAQDKHLAVFYADFFPRPGKRAGAWMTSYRGQKRSKGQDQRPHVSIVCNFNKPSEDKPSLLTFNEVTTLFHEFGHALHGMLADGQYESLSGTSVYWDFVELPSQIMENWCYEKEALDLFAHHYETKEAIPAELIQKIIDSANYLEGYQNVRQISFARLDMHWHSQNPTDIDSVATFEQEAMQATELFPPVEGTNMSTAFSHIFQGGYSSGYYSYKWAEVLDADAFELFKENGIFDPETARSFKENILSRGGSEHPMELYRRFRGKEPSPEALLRKAGLLQ